MKLYAGLDGETEQREEKKTTASQDQQLNATLSTTKLTVISPNYE